MVVQFPKTLEKNKRTGEYAAAGIRVNAVLTGITNSGMAPEGGSFKAEAIKITPMGRAATPDEMAPGILYLASDESSFCTGTMLAIDGGATSL